MKYYIQGYSAISAQPTFVKKGENTEWVAHEQDGNWLKTLEPNYRDLIEPVLSRRMSRIVKMSIATASEALREAGIGTPDAIIVGTGLGCMVDTEKFLKDIMESDEGLMSPTAFIQSTHNTVAGQIALIVKCKGYNFTYTNRGHSFENALQDGMLQLAEGQNQVLIGGAEEVTDMVFRTYREMECAGENTPGDRKPLLGEGASFFVIGKEPGASGVALEGLRIFNSVKPRQIQERILVFLKESGITTSDIDALVLGYNRDLTDPFYAEAKKVFSASIPIIQFKNASGEYFTASSFGLFLATEALHTQSIPPWALMRGEKNDQMKYVLMYNHYKGYNHSFVLLSRLI